MKSLHRLPEWGALVLLLPFLWQCSSSIQQTSTNQNKGFRPFPVGSSRSALQAASLSKKSSPQETTIPQKGRRIALLIGINEYRDKTWHRLRFAAKDANDLARVLREKKLGHFNTMMLHVGRSSTTKASILAAFKKLASLNVNKHDTVLVYVSGHGTLARDKQYRMRRYLVTHDANAKDIHNTALAINRLRKLFNGLKSQRKVLLLATCHSGNGKSGLNGKVKAELRTLKGPFFVKPMELVSRATIFLGVCGFGETAQESSKLRNDIYTHYFIKALKNRYDANGDGAVTVLEAHDYAKELTYHHTHGRQRPYAESDILGTDPIVLVGKKKRLGKPVLYAYNNRFFGVEVRVNGTPKGTFPRGIDVGTGKQKITLVTPTQKVLFQGDVYFRSGQRMEVNQLFESRFFSFSMAAKSGYQIFLEGSSEDRMTANLPIFGIDLRWKRFAHVSVPLDLRLEFAFARNSHALAAQDNRPQTVTELNLGVALLYHFDWKMISAFTGIRLSGIYLDRQSDLHVDINDFFFSFQPGLLLGGEWRLHPRWSLFAESRLNYTYITTADGQPRHQGSFEIVGGFHFHF
tara:strand:+ start:50080 stop:51807 length:1728 start_codon:yes stop_codon:yes gene_type:complete